MSGKVVGATTSENEDYMVRIPAEIMRRVEAYLTPYYTPNPQYWMRNLVVRELERAERQGKQHIWGFPEPQTCVVCGARLVVWYTTAEKRDAFRADRRIRPTCDGCEDGR